MPLTDITHQWLTERLQLRGYAVTAQHIQVLQHKTTPISSVYHLCVTYAERDHRAPDRLFLKIPNLSVYQGREIQFYTQVAPEMLAAHPQFPVVRYYDVEHDPQRNHAHMLLEDISHTHFAINEVDRPARVHYEQVIEGFAMLHAHWWQDPRLGNGIGQWLTETDIMQSEARTKARHDQLLRDASNEFDAEQRRIVAQVARGWPSRRRERVLNGQGITIVHRDPHPHNFMYPRKGGQVRIIDWDAWRVDTGTDDLAYMMACNWSTVQRTQLETSMLRLYYQKMLAFGVGGYSWDDFYYDYQASIVRCLFFLLAAYSADNRTRGIWWQRMRRGIAAYEQYRCDALWS